MIRPGRTNKPARDWQAFIEKYNRAGGKDDNAAVFGYAAAETLAQVLKQCGNDLSRENVMKQAAALENYQGSMLLPGIKISTGPWNFRPIKHLRLIQFDGRTWQPIGEVLETAFLQRPEVAVSGQTKCRGALDWALPLSPPRSREAMGNQEPN